jgi:subtilisin family serine protease
MSSSSKENNRNNISRIGRFEEFESRIVMSAQAVASVLPDAQVDSTGAFDSVEPAAIVSSVNSHGNDISPTTAAAQLAQQYGLDGTGQTIAVIDTGIAFDHVALGGGYGEGHRVVGGYDFAEDDANPYDDGPTGFHGTSVAGIIGSTDLEYMGLAPGADLVALRVFDDAGRNELEWVEQALQWVHDNQFNFENPITTVNLSLGTTPDESYQMILEDELAQLKEDGIFISVAAGNHFNEANSFQLAYPASSSSVVPVSSHTSTGEFSDFSQRASHVLTAPGQSIVSTVPEHLFFGTRTDPFVGSSGTSFSAPYVAGASALLRQANQIAGVENIDQDLIYHQLLSTADQVFDTVTNATYSHVNLQAAIESILNGPEAPPVAGQSPNVQQPIPEDQATTDTTTGTNNDSLVSLSDGVLNIEGSSVDDVVSLTVDDRTNSLTVNLNGQSSAFALTRVDQINYSGNGGNDDLAITLGNSDDTVTIKQRKVEILNQIFQLAADDVAKVNIDNGNGSDTLKVEGSVNDDHLLATSQNVSFSNENFEANAGHFRQINANAGAGNDSVELQGTEGNDTFAEYKQTSWLKSDIHRVLTEGFESVRVDGGGGTDQANLSATDLAERFDINQSDATLVQGNRQIDINAFRRINVLGAGAEDTVSLSGSSGDDILYSKDGSASLVGERFLTYVSRFENLNVNGGGGNDIAYLAGSSGDDHFSFGQDSATLESDDHAITTKGFDLTVARSTGGHDTASFTGTQGRDHFYADNIFAEASGEGLAVGRTIGFDEVSIDGNDGNDVVTFKGSDNDDSLTIGLDDIEFETTLQMLRLTNIERSHFRGGDGNDTVKIEEAESLDLLQSLGDGAQAVLKNHTASFSEIEELEANAVDDAIAAYDLETVDFRFNLNGKWYDLDKLGN